MSSNLVLLRAVAGLLLAGAGACGGVASSEQGDQGIAVQVVPSTAQMQPGGAVSFSATVTGTVNTSVSWSVQEASGGSVDGSGHYTAPASTGTFHVVATSLADPAKSGSATVTVGTVSPGTIIPADRRTTWNPGIPGGIPSRTTVCAQLAAATFGNGSSDAGPAIQAAIDACPEGQVVSLGAGTFKTSVTLRLVKGVVLRGAGSTGGGHPATTINRSPAGTVVAMGRVSNTGNADLGAGVNLASDALKGSTEVVVASASAFKAGDIVQIDQVDDALVLNSAPYDCPYFKRTSNRSIGQRIEIASISGSTLTLTSPLHWTFATSHQAQVAPVGQPITRNAGLEGVRLIGGNHPYDGGGVDVWNAAYSWIKDIETDTITGMHIVLSGTYRFVVRDSYAHHSGNYGYGTGCYGIVIRFQAADNLVENNIARYVNKPILFNASGGGNVVGYNYADDSWATPGWQELNIDCHCNFPHMELIEGNYAPHMGMSSTHGNAGFLTFFRNYSSTQFFERTGLTGNVAALELDTGAQSMNAVGNVFGKAGLQSLYEEVSDDGNCGTPHMYLLGSGYMINGCTWSSNPSSDPAITTLLRHGNFDFVNNATVWSPSIAERTIPASLYLAGPPAFWPSGAPWPWTGPDASPMIGVLPAKDRFDKMPP
jgi:hypothetical protein